MRTSINELKRGQPELNCDQDALRLRNNQLHQISKIKPLKPKHKPIRTKDIMAHKYLREDGIFAGQEKIDLYGGIMSCMGCRIDLPTMKSLEK